MKDKYDEAVEWLRKHPRMIYDVWLDGYWKKRGAAVLFARAGEYPCGCLTLVKAGEAQAETEQLTREIRRDKRLPISPFDIRPKHLPVFAEWQRRLDRELPSRRAKA